MAPATLLTRWAHESRYFGHSTIHFFCIPDYDPQLCMKKHTAARSSATLLVQGSNRANRPKFADRNKPGGVPIMDDTSSKASLVSIQNRLLYNARGDTLRYDRLCSNVFAPVCVA